MKENTLLSRKQETVATVPSCNDIEKPFHSCYTFSFSKAKFAKKD